MTSDPTGQPGELNEQAAESLLLPADFDIDDDPRGTLVDFVTAPEDGFDW